MKPPKPIKALAIVNKDNPKIDIFDIYKQGEEVELRKGEAKCLVEISFIRYLK